MYSAPVTYRIVFRSFKETQSLIPGQSRKNSHLIGRNLVLDWSHTGEGGFLIVKEETEMGGGLIEDPSCFFIVCLQINGNSNLRVIQ